MFFFIKASFTINRWFVSNKGKDLSPKEKHLDTLSYKSSRLIWVKDWYGVLTDKYANVAMLDEKWFYTTNRRREIKKLHIGPGEWIEMILPNIHK